MSYQFSSSNYNAVIRGFNAKGIPTAEIRPKENVLTYELWQQQGRQVRRGERGVSVVTLIPMTDKDTGTTYRRPRRATVFHITQTEPIGQQTPTAPRRAQNIYETMPDDALAAIAATGKGKALVELSEAECMAMMEQMRRAALNPTLDRISEGIAAELPAPIDVTPITPTASPETEYNPQLAAERVAERRETRRAEQLRETAQWFTMLPASEIEPIIGHMPGTKEYGQFKSWNRLTQEAQDALHYARTVNPQTPRERVLAGQPVSILDLMPDKIDKRPGQPQPLKPTIKRRDFKF